MTLNGGGDHACRCVGGTILPERWQKLSLLIGRPPCPTRDLIGYRYQKALRRRNRIDVALAQANGVLRLSPVAAG